MCEYCGCQAVTVIAELTSEHDAVVAMIGEARAAVARQNPARAADVARRIATALAPHTRVEEEGLFPALAGEFPEHVAGLRDEHRRIEAVLAEADGATPADPTWPDRLLHAMRLLRDHILKEQDGVFPAALASLRPADWEQVERVRAGLATRRPSVRDDRRGRHRGEATVSRVAAGNRAIGSRTVNPSGEGAA